MAWIRTIPEAEADGALKKHYDSAVGRSGQIAGIVKLHSLHVPTLRASMNLYFATTTMEENPLLRWHRELIATVVSRTNECFY
jgi:hypothetical protein